MATSRRQTVPLSAPLLILISAGVLMAYFRFLRHMRVLSPFGHGLIFVLAGGTFVAGVRQILLLRRGAGSRAGAANNSRKSLFDLPWLGIALVAVGVETLLATMKFRDTIIRGSLAVGGISAVFWGLQSLTSNTKFRARTGRVRHSIELPAQGAVYIAIMTVLFMGSMLSRSNMLLLVFAMMAAPFVINGSIIFSMLRRLTLRRQFPEAVTAGEPFTVEVFVTNEKRVFASSLLTITDEVVNGNDNIAPSALIARVPPRETRVARYQMCLMHRGRCEFRSIKASTQFPLGIVERGATVELPNQLLVYPRVGRLTSAWKREHGIADEMVRRSDTRKGVFDDEFHRLREYRIGDNPRSIHWRTSARQNELMLREFHQSRNFELTILIDLWHPAKLETADRDRIELAISFAATLAKEQLVQSRDSGLNVAIAGGEFTEWRGPGGPAGLQSLMELLATVDGSKSPDVDALILYGRSRRGPATRTLWVTSRPPYGEPFAALEAVTGNSDFGRELNVFSSEPRDLQRWFMLT